jgi:hypothetical protein
MGLTYQHKHIGGGVLLRPLMVEDYALFWDLLDSIKSTAGRESWHYARLALRKFTTARWLPRYRIKKLFKPMVEAMGVTKQAETGGQGSQEAKAQIYDMLLSIGVSLGKTPRELAGQVTLDDLAPIAFQIQKRDIENARMALGVQHGDPKSTIKNLQSAVRKIGCKAH